MTKPSYRYARPFIYRRYLYTVVESRKKIPAYESAAELVHSTSVATSHRTSLISPEIRS